MTISPDWPSKAEQIVHGLAYGGQVGVDYDEWKSLEENLIAVLTAAREMYKSDSIDRSEFTSLEESIEVDRQFDAALEQLYETLENLGLDEEE